MRAVTTSGVAHLARAVAATLRAVIGAPDYERYLAHMHRRHPTETPATFEEFDQQRITNRYLKPGARCC